MTARTVAEFPASTHALCDWCACAVPHAELADDGICQRCHREIDSEDES